MDFKFDTISSGTEEVKVTQTVTTSEHTTGIEGVIIRHVTAHGASVRAFDVHTRSYEGTIIEALYTNTGDNGPPIRLASVCYTSPFACCGAGAVSAPWLSGPRVLRRAGVSEVDLINAILTYVFLRYNVTYLVQVDRAGRSINGSVNGKDHMGAWKLWIDSYDGDTTELYNKHVNIQHGDSILAGFAFVNPKALKGSRMYRKYSGTYKAGNIK